MNAARGGRATRLSGRPAGMAGDARGVNLILRRCHDLDPRRRFQTAVEDGPGGCREQRRIERELIVERTRDKIAATCRKGKWAGGWPVLGYDIAPKGVKRSPQSAPGEGAGGAAGERVVRCP